MRIEGSWDLKERGFGEAWVRRRGAGLYDCVQWRGRIRDTRHTGKGRVISI